MSENTVRSTDEPGDSSKMVPQQEVPPEKSEKQGLHQTETSPQQTLSSSGTAEDGPPSSRTQDVLPPSSRTQDVLPPSSKTQDVVPPSSRTQDVLPETKEQSPNIKNGNEASEESSSTNLSDANCLEPSSEQNHNNGPVEDKQAKENGVTRDPQLDERLKESESSEVKDSHPCVKDTGSNGDTDLSSGLHVNNVDVIHSSKMNNDSNTSKNNFIPSINEINCESTKKRKADDDIDALASASEDDLLEGENQREGKRLKTSHNDLSSSSIKNGLCSGSKDGYNSDDSMGVDEPEAVECNSDEEAQLLGEENTSKEEPKDNPLHDIQSEKNKQSDQVKINESAATNGTTNLEIRNSNSVESDAKNDSSEESDISKVINAVPSQSVPNKDMEVEPIQKLKVSDGSSSSSVNVQEKESSEIKTSSVSSAGELKSSVDTNDTEDTNIDLMIKDEEASSKPETSAKDQNNCEDRVTVSKQKSSDPIEQTNLSRTASLEDIQKGNVNQKDSREKESKSEFSSDSDLDMDCTTEELSEAQDKYFTKLNADFQLLLSTTQTYIPKTRSGRRGSGRKGGYAPRVVSPPVSSASSTPTSSSTTYPSRARSRSSKVSIASAPSRTLPPRAAAAAPSVAAPSPAVAPTVSNSTSRRGSRATPSPSPSTSSRPVSPRSSNSLLPKRTVPQRSYREESPEIEVVSEKRPAPVPPLPVPQPPRKELPKKPISGASCTSLLNILARPRNMHPVVVAVKDRKELDVMVKSSLVKNHQNFTEWLFALRLLKDKLTCIKHPHTTGIRLGAYQTPSVLPASGGYVWLVECCPGGRKYVSVYSGSIFAIGLKENISATSVLKLIYHWSCQTTISNVENWVKVSRDVIGRTYHYLRCVCSVILQDKLYDMGAQGTTVELGIVSLGTTSADGAKKAVKVEILGLYDRVTEAYRLYASSPQNNANSSQRFMRILKPVLSVVHHNAVIVCDFSIDRTCLPVMNYKKVEFCNQNQEGTNENSNATIMSYLRKHVPRMFQNSLSQLSLEQVQLVLDELCWRESFGRSPSHSYTNIMKQLGYLTSRESVNNGLLSLLDFVALNPHKSWRYVPDNRFRPIPVPPISPPALHPDLQPMPVTVPINRNVAPTVHPAIDVDASSRNRSTLSSTPIDVDPSNVVNPLLHGNKMVLSIINNQVHPIRNTNKARSIPPLPNVAATNQVINRSFGFSDSARKLAPVNKSAELIDLVPHFYGEVPGREDVAQETNFCDIECHKCHEKTRDNIAFYEHMKTHLFDHRLPSMIMCRYCILQFPDNPTYQNHIKEVHSSEHRQGHLCRICMVSFERENFLITHMVEKHVEAELPYRCEVCNYATSYYTNVIDHFTEKHRGTPYIQCHFCLMVKVVSPGNLANVSLWLLSHLMEHAKGVRCNYCVLSIKSKSKKIISAHMVAHNTYKLRKDLVRYPPSNSSLKFPATGLIGRQRVSPVLANPMAGMRPAVAMSRLVENTDTLEVDADDDDLCKECEQPMNTLGHYMSYQACTQCPYATNCSVMMPRHNYVFHPYKKTRHLTYDIGPPIVLSKPLVCNCGFATTSGNHMAGHLAACGDSTKTAYPPLPPSRPSYHPPPPPPPAHQPDGILAEMPTLDMLLDSHQHQASLEHFLTAFDGPSVMQSQPHHGAEAQGGHAPLY